MLGKKIAAYNDNQDMYCDLRFVLISHFTT